jgi:SNF2 family DNA or RNA helicase
VEIVDNRALKLTVRNPDRITQVIPKSKVIEQRDDGLHEVLVHWGHDETRVLKNLGIKNVPSPILGKYNWPGLYKPFEHQRATAAFLTMHQRAFCLNEQGCGKSASVAWAADYLMERRIIRKALIICPLSIMNTAWLADIFRVSMHRTADVCHGLKDKRKQIIARDAEFLIINFDGVKTVLPELMKAKFDLIVIDEANCIKNATSDRWKAINSLVGQDTWVWALTGSPASQSPTDAYGLAKMVSPHNVPRLFSMFRDQVQYKITTFRYANKPDAMSTVHKVLQPAIRFTKQECLDLPELVYATREVPLTTQQAKYYKQLKEHMRIQAAGEDITAPNAAVNLNKLLQCSAGSVYSDTKEVIEFDVSTRLHELDSIIEECQHKILLFATFRHSIDLLQRHITNLGISTEVIHGGISANKRTEVITSFQTKDSPRILIIQPQSAAHGVTLTKADTIVWWSLPTSYEIYTQANARIHRPGQVNHCTVIHLIGSPVEKKLLHAIEKREESQISLLDMFKDELMS